MEKGIFDIGGSGRGNTWRGRTCEELKKDQDAPLDEKGGNGYVQRRHYASRSFHADRVIKSNALSKKESAQTVEKAVRPQGIKDKETNIKKLTRRK